MKKFILLVLLTSHCWLGNSFAGPKEPKGHTADKGIPKNDYSKEYHPKKIMGLQELVEKHKIPALAGLLLQDGVVTYADVFGKRVINDMTNTALFDDKFHFGSIAKNFYSDIGGGIN